MGVDTGVTVADLKTELAAIRAAKLACLTAMQSVNRPGLGYTRVDYDKLCQQEAIVVQSIARSSVGIIAVGEIQGSTTDYPQDSNNWNE